MIHCLKTDQLKLRNLLDQYNLNATYNIQYKLIKFI